MARRILVQHDGQDIELGELLADSEAELQEILRASPNLIPLDDLGLDGPMLVIGVETSLRSGRADLLGLAPSGDVLIVEFKTGPQNSDFRHALAQLLDYGADLWQMDLSALEASAEDYLARHAGGQALMQTTIREAAAVLWGTGDTWDPDSFERALEDRLADGAFHFVLVAQVITSNMRDTIGYLQETHIGHFHGVELVKFGSVQDEVVAFEGRAVTSPQKSSRPTTSSTMGSVTEALDGVADLEHREELRRLIDYCHSLGMSKEIGSAGLSIRIRVPDRKEPVTVAWVYPPETTGWMGLHGLNLGFDTATVKDMSVKPMFDDYLRALRSLPDAIPMERGNLRGVEVNPTQFAAQAHRIKDALGALAASIGDAS